MFNKGKEDSIWVQFFVNTCKIRYLCYCIFMRYSKEETLQQLVYRQLVTQIAEGILRPGSELPSLRELMSMYGVSRNTVQLVMKRLVQEKIIRNRSCRRFKVNDFLLPRVALITSGAVTWDRFRYSYGAWGFEIGQAVYYALRERGFLPIFLPRPFDIEHWKKLISGAVIFNNNQLKASVFEQSEQAGIRPLLQILNQDLSAGTNLYFDRTPGMLALANYFTVYGVNSVGLLGEFAGTNLAWNIDNKLLPELQMHRPVEVFRIPCGIAEEHGTEAMRQLLEQHPRLPLGIFAAGDFVARGAVKYAMKQGLKLKKDLLVSGCTGLAESGAWHPPLSVLTTPFRRIGNLAAEIIAQQINGTVMPENMVVKSRLIIRNT